MQTMQGRGFHQGIVIAQWQSSEPATSEGSLIAISFPARPLTYNVFRVNSFENEYAGVLMYLEPYAGVPLEHL